MLIQQQLGRWLPGLAVWFSDRAPAEPELSSALLPVIQEFQDLIESDATLFMFFTSMFDEIPLSPPYDKDTIGNPQVRDYRHMLKLFNGVIQEGPPWVASANAAGFGAFPINVILNWPMGTPSGHAVFLDNRVNAMFKKMFDVWAKHLASPASTSVLNESEGWLCPGALQALTACANLEARTDLAFQDIYNCDPSKPTHGFTSWDNFFTRTFKDGLRPVSNPEDQSTIVNPCESSPYRLTENISRRDKFWVKGQPYSLDHMLADDPLVSRFVGGTIYQAFLGPLNYHRWHSPVAGTIIKTRNIHGSYYSQSILNTFMGDGPDPTAPLRSRAYITAVASRAAIFIQSENEDIGMVCVLPVGMQEISSCEVTVRAGQRVRKGEEIGIFHFGGSTVCLIFENGLDLEWEAECLPPYPSNAPNIAVGKKIARVCGPKVEILEADVWVL